MTAVAVWQHRPTDREVLDARLARGWKPTPTTMWEGERVMGYAACVFNEEPLGANAVGDYHIHPD